MDKNDDVESELERTFVNPFASVPCEKCEFVAKSRHGLQVHMRAKHRESNEILLPQTFA